MLACSLLLCSNQIQTVYKWFSWYVPHQCNIAWPEMPLRDLIRGEMSPSSGETLSLRLRLCLFLSMCQKKKKKTWYKNYCGLNAADSRLFAPPHADATTAAAWTTTPKSASCLRSLRSAISARALTTWLPAAQSKHSSPRRVLRESRLPPEETKKSMATRRRLATALIRRETGKVWNARGSRG